MASLYDLGASERPQAYLAPLPVQLPTMSVQHISYDDGNGLVLVVHAGSQLSAYSVSSAAATAATNTLILDAGPTEGPTTPTSDAGPPSPGPASPGGSGLRWTLALEDGAPVRGVRGSLDGASLLAVQRSDVLIEFVHRASGRLWVRLTCVVHRMLVTVCTSGPSNLLVFVQAHRFVPPCPVNSKASRLFLFVTLKGLQRLHGPQQWRPAARRAVHTASRCAHPRILLGCRSVLRFRAGHRCRPGAIRATTRRRHLGRGRPL
jgi:hypothetical protein